MKKRNNLILLTDSYPFGIGELFLDKEVELLSHLYETIYVYSLEEDSVIARPFPANLVLWNPMHLKSLHRTIYLLKALLFKEVWKDFFSVQMRFKHKSTFLHFKILLADFMKAACIASDISKYCSNYSIDMNQTIFYSYWHDSKALALCLIKNKYKIKAIARGHGWDLDYPRHQPAYLPYKNFLVSTLDKSISISEYGARKLRELTDFSYHDKIIVSHLGTLNTNTSLSAKNNNARIICSCSSLIPLKRVDRIIEVLASLQLHNFHWVHFGDGPLRAELENLANEFNLSAEFKGNVNNEEILKYYAENYVDLFINLSTSEGIPVSIMEAQSAGIPVLALDVGGCSEIVNNENGLLLPAEATNSDIAKAITEYLTSPQESIESKRSYSYENWKNNFSAEENYKEFVKMLTQI
ncbi:MAG: glycosyltransferase [Chitinophagales bacterium]|nr:glycosyltransferase [Chitinophagales bacterium]